MTRPTHSCTCTGYWQELNRYDQALSSFEKALVLQPDLFPSQLGKVECLAHCKRYQESVDMAAELALENPQDYRILYMQVK